MLRAVRPLLGIALAVGLFWLWPAGCGDVCVSCGDGEDGGGDGGGDGPEAACEIPFPGLTAFQAAGNVSAIDTFPQQPGQPSGLSLATVPAGMSFPYGANRTADPGDVLLADPQGDSIVVYELPDTQGRALLTGFGDVSGLALLHQATDTTTYDLLFFTVRSENALYVYDLAGTSIPAGLDNPFPITNGLIGTNFFESPAALASGQGTGKVTIFVLNDNGADSSVRRLSVDLETWLPEAPQTIATITNGNRSLAGLAFSNETGALFVSRKAVNGVGGWVYKIPDARETTSATDLDRVFPFLQRNQRISGIAVVPRNADGSKTRLLLLREGIGAGQVQEVNTAIGDLQDAFTTDPLLQFHQAIAYDCAEGRLLLTDVPLNPDLPRTFLQALSTR